MLRTLAHAGWMAGLILAALVAPTSVLAQTPPAVTFTNISDAVAGRCYDPANTRPDPTNPNRLNVAIHTGTVAGTFGTSAGCHASDEGSPMAGDTIVFVANAPAGYYISKVSFSQTATTSGSRGGRGFAGANWVVSEDALPAAVGGTSAIDLTGKNLTVVPVSYTTVLAAAGGTVRSGSATATNPFAIVELLPLETEPPPPPPPPPPVPMPMLASVSPDSVTARGPAFTLTVTGSGFVPGSVVQWNGANRSTTPVNGSQLRATILASDIAVHGMAEVRVFNPASGHYVPDDGGYSSPMSVTILPAPDPNPVPVATSLEPSSAIVGTGAFTLTVNGSNFIPGSVVRWNGENRSTTFVSSGRVTAVIGVLDLFFVGQATVTVFNPATGFNPPPDGGTSAGLTFTITDVPSAPPPVPGPSPTAAQGHVNDMRGRLWRQLTASRGLTRAALAQACPQDGVTPCTGSVGGVDLTDWVWATAPQVFDLFSYFTTGVNPTTPSVSGFQYATVAGQFQTLFPPTQALSGCTTYQGCFDFRLSAGMTSSTEAGGGPIGGSVTLSTNEFGSFVGAFSVGAMADDASSTRGVFLWRPTGHGAGTVHAYNDAGQSSSPYGGLAVNLLANDWVGGVPATSATATVSVVSPPSPPTDRITVSADGSVQTLAGALAGTYSLGYRACATGSSTNCDTASATVTVRSFLLVATNDSASAPYGAGGSPVNVLTNDSLNGQAVNTTVVSLLQVSSTHAGITLNTATGAVSVAAGTPSGTHTLSYQVCEIASPTNCKTATVTLTARVIDAVDDVFPKLSKDGAITPSVLTNDRVNGAAAMGLVQASVLTTLPAFVSFDQASGRFTIVKGVESGDYPVTYRICEIGNPTNCDTASLTLEISGSAN